MINEIVITSGDNKQVNAQAGEFTIKTDQPQPSGDGTAPAPFDIFLASIGTCTGIYVFSFCKKRGIPTEGVRIIQKMEEKPEEEGYGVKAITMEVCVPDNFPDKYKAALIKAASLCAVKKHLEVPPKIEVVVKKVLSNT